MFFLGQFAVVLKKTVKFWEPNIETFNIVWQKEGMKGLYRGWSITAARAAPAHAAIFAVYEYTLKLLNSYEHGT